MSPYTQTNRKIKIKLEISNYNQVQRTSETKISKLLHPDQECLQWQFEIMYHIYINVTSFRLKDR